MDDSLSIQLNHEIQRLFRLSSYRDLDSFGTQLSRSIAGRIISGDSLSEAIRASVPSVETGFFRVNRSVNRDGLRRQIELQLRTYDLPPNDLPGSISDFRKFAERQLAQELWKNRSDEGVLRSHLQTFLEARHGRTLKEMVTGRGRTDVALVDGGTSEVIETKLWKGEAYFRDGLVELAQYLRTEDLGEGHYVVLDCSLENGLVEENGPEWIEEVEGRHIRVYFVCVRPATPSRLARARRSARDI